ncbi:sigma-70 family RNA polymerase sigma factor [Asticcacaulis sp. AND118]|uniref:sigma-70 family RNA polymerase sigma factor n=1 Tax=Asticcacaulis sp. AND118 TaxID=2840468 RepID=UPI001CFF9149|nr:sigma-70 family RNA polymerase sigma factor [Asticcacaulis sp. AND118]UDF04238.1 sigma-70 family RNA polymerase sigma factor [Asticcacaulis sp. AND118]
MRDAVGDAQLMRLTAEGDAAAFRQLVARHLPRAHAVAYRVLLNREDAEEAVQAAFTKVWTNAGRFEPERSAFSTWLYTIVTRACLDRARRFKPKTQPIEDWAEALSDGDPDAEAHLLQQQNARLVRDAVAQLPTHQRMAVAMCYFEGFSNAEAAQSLNISVKALESVLVRARRQLKTVLGVKDD